MKTEPKYYITKRPNGVHYICKKDNGKVTWKTTKLKKRTEAVKFMLEYIEQDKKPVSKVPTMSEFKPTYEAIVKAVLRERTVSENLRYIDIFLKEAGDLPLDEYTNKQFSDIRNKLLASGVTGKAWSRGGCNKFTQTIKSVFQRALDNEDIIEHPLKKIAQLGIPPRKPLFLSRKELQDIVAAEPSTNMQDIYIFGAYTGLRIGEILNLRSEHVIIDEHPRVLVRNTDTFTTKTSSERECPLVDKLVQMMIRRKGKRMYIFGKNKTERYSIQAVSARFKKAVRKTTVDKDIHFHSLRHTFCSWLAQNSVDIYTIAKLAGHMDVKTTQVYSHLIPNELRKEVNKMPDFGGEDSLTVDKWSTQIRKDALPIL